jgi:transcriptional regulator with XRE-family HTH domain
MTPEPAAALAQQLKLLRIGRKITQDQLAKAMGVSVPLISSWESVRNPVPPPDDRLRSYAEFFASTRSTDQHRWRPIGRAELTEEEDIRREELENELLGLRASAIGGAPATRPTASVSMGSGPWRFPANQDITIVCAQLPEQMRLRMRYADPSDPDYVMLYNYADLDSLVELHGHVRATNPDSEVRFKLATDLNEDDYTSHLVLLGGVDWNMVTRQAMAKLDLPVRQVSHYDQPGDAAFEVGEGAGVRRYAPLVDIEAEDRKILREDVAQFVRGPNPFNRRRTVTICNGMYGQGTYGAVRTLTDARFRDRNNDHLSTRFPAGSTYSVLFRVSIVKSIAVTPDWTAPGTVLHEWSEATE